MNIGPLRNSNPLSLLSGLLWSFMVSAFWFYPIIIPILCFLVFYGLSNYYSPYYVTHYCTYSYYNYHVTLHCTYYYVTHYRTYYSMMCKHFEWAMSVVKQDDKGYLALTKVHWEQYR